MRYWRYDIEYKKCTLKVNIALKYPANTTMVCSSKCLLMRKNGFQHVGNFIISKWATVVSIIKHEPLHSLEENQVFRIQLWNERTFWIISTIYKYSTNIIFKSSENRWKKSNTAWKLLSVIRSNTQQLFGYKRTCTLTETSPLNLPYPTYCFIIVNVIPHWLCLAIARLLYMS